MPVGRKTIDGFVSDPTDSRTRGISFSIDLPIDVGLVGGEEEAQNVLIFLENIPDEEFEIIDERRSIVNATLGFVFENGEGVLIAKVFPEELEKTGVFIFGVIEKTLDVRSELFTGG